MKFYFGLCLYSNFVWLCLDLFIFKVLVIEIESIRINFVVNLILEAIVRRASRVRTIFRWIIFIFHISGRIIAFTNFIIRGIASKFKFWCSRNWDRLWFRDLCLLFTKKISRIWFIYNRFWIKSNFRLSDVSVICMLGLCFVQEINLSFSISILCILNCCIFCNNTNETLGTLVKTQDFAIEMT